jgi:hypothetical protein
MLCSAVRASGGFVALAANGHYAVAASVRSLPSGTVVPAEALPEGDEGPPAAALDGNVAWLAPAYAGAEVVGVVGLGPREPHGQYANHDRALLLDVADWVSRVAPAQRQQQSERDLLTRLAAEVPSRELELEAASAHLRAVLAAPLEEDLLHAVEEALRHLADYAWLGESPLVARLGLAGETHVARGKALRQRLEAAIEGLRPAGPAPREPWPREWHGYATMRQAYLEDVPNREITARLYVSDSTFARARRKAMRAVARSLIETSASG